jgi:hypothetical protein
VIGVIDAKYRRQKATSYFKVDEVDFKEHYQMSIIVGNSGFRRNTSLKDVSEMWTLRSGEISQIRNRVCLGSILHFMC